MLWWSPLTDVVVSGPFGEELGVVDPLGARQDLLAPHEHVVGVAPAAVARVRHRVEGPHRQRVLVQDEEVRVVLTAAEGGGGRHMTHGPAHRTTGRLTVPTLECHNMCSVIIKSVLGMKSTMTS